MNEPKYKGVRAFGSRHHGNGKDGTLWGGEALRPLVDKLIAEVKATGASLPKKEKGFFLTSPPSEEHSPSGEVAPSEKKDSALAEGSEHFSPSEIRAREAAPYKRWETHWSLAAAINAPAVRHERLAWLVGQMFYQTGRAMAEQIVKLQFDQRTVITKADWAEHRAEFLELWRGLMAHWLATLSQPERDQLQILMPEAERDSFRILRGFYTLAARKSCDDFPVAQADLAARLGVSKQYGGQIIAHFDAGGILARTAPPVPHKAAARYRWLLPTEPPGVPTSSSLGAGAPVAAPVSVPTMHEIPAIPALAVPAAASSEATMAQTAPPPPPTQFIELRLLQQLLQVGTLNFDKHRESMQRQGHTPEVIAARVPRLQRAADRLVAAQLAYRLDELTASWNPPHGPRPPHNVAELIFFSAVKDRRYTYGAISVALRSVRDWPNEAACRTIADKLVSIGLLTPDYRVNEDPEQLRSL